ncbi:MAG: hypothetical protein DMG38_11915 [Acidobacteria bacterium]|nr:MAG: hypothetical protein DMG38_11915 [Acidobacteriota bacterium]
MTSNGYEAAIPFGAIAAGRIPGQYLFSKPDSKLLVELHNDLTLRSFPRRLPLEDFFSADSRMAGGELTPPSSSRCSLRLCVLCPENSRKSFSGNASEPLAALGAASRYAGLC